MVGQMTGSGPAADAGAKTSAQPKRVHTPVYFTILHIGLILLIVSRMMSPVWCEL